MREFRLAWRLSTILLVVLSGCSKEMQDTSASDSPREGQPPQNHDLTADTTPPDKAVSSHASKPAIIIYSSPGWGPNAGTGSFEIAVWADGRILWRDADSSRRSEDNAPTGERFFESHVSSQSVSVALKTLRKEGVYEVDPWGFVVPDWGGTIIVIRDDYRRLKLESSGEPPATAPYEFDPERWSKGLAAWRLIRRVARSLIPQHNVSELETMPDYQGWRWDATDSN